MSEYNCPVCQKSLASLSSSKKIDHVESCLKNPIPQADPFPTSSESPFGVKCPWCFYLYESSDFPTHVAWQHRQAHQQKECPICFLMTGEHYHVNVNTNLFAHLVQIHPDIEIHYPPNPPTLPQRPPRTLVRASSHPHPPISSIRRSAVPRASSASPDSHKNTRSSARKKNSRLQGKFDQPRSRISAPSTKSSGKAHKPPVSMDIDSSSVSNATRETQSPLLKTVEDDSYDYLLSRCVENPHEIECNICYELYEPEELTARLQCFCLFHKECVEAWFQSKGARHCPVHDQEKPWASRR